MNVEETFLGFQGQITVNMSRLSIWLWYCSVYNLSPKNLGQNWGDLPIFKIII